MEGFAELLDGFFAGPIPAKVRAETSRGGCGTGMALKMPVSLGEELG